MSLHSVSSLIESTLISPVSTIPTVKNPNPLPDKVVSLMLKYIEEIAPEELEGNSDKNLLAQKYLISTVSFLRVLTEEKLDERPDIFYEKDNVQTIVLKIKKILGERIDGQDPEKVNCAIQCLRELSDTVTCLDLFNRGLDVYPVHLNLFQKLMILGLEHNQLDSLKGMRELKELDSLNVSSNKLVDITNVVSCRSLRILDVSYNAIRELPAELLKSEDLRELNFESNQLMEEPDLSQSNLEKSNFSDNGFETTPVEYPMYGAGSFPFNPSANNEQCCTVM